MFAQDEAIIKLNPTMRKVYAPKGTKPIRLVNGSKQKLYLFSVVSDEGNHCCTYDWINSDNFLKFVKYLLRMHKKIVLIADRATWHTSKKVKDFVEDMNKIFTLVFSFLRKIDRTKKPFSSPSPDDLISIAAYRKISRTSEK